MPTHLVPDAHRVLFLPGYNMNVWCEVGRLRFNDATRIKKTRLVKRICIRMQHPVMVRSGAETNHDVRFREGEDDLSQIEAAVRAKMIDLYRTYEGMFHWEVAVGGMRAAVMDHWTNATPSRQKFLEANQ